MSEPTGADRLSLTGVWNGLYSYPRALKPVSFTAILIETGTSFSGTTHEKDNSGGTVGAMLYATLSGQRQGFAVSFLKSYDGTEGWTHSVEYEGQLSGDGTEIEGRWRVPGVWSGKFLMVRAGDAQRTLERKVLEPVGRS